jgi:hypothetical protein
MQVSSELDGVSKEKVRMKRAKTLENAFLVYKLKVDRSIVF